MIFFLVILALAATTLTMLWRTASRRRTRAATAGETPATASPLSERRKAAQLAADCDLPWMDFDAGGVLTPAQTRAWLAEQAAAEQAPQAAYPPGLPGGRGINTLPPGRYGLGPGGVILPPAPTVLPERPSFLGWIDLGSVSDLSPTAGPVSETPPSVGTGPLTPGYPVRASRLERATWVRENGQPAENDFDKIEIQAWGESEPIRVDEIKPEILHPPITEAEADRLRAEAAQILNAAVAGRLTVAEAAFRLSETRMKLGLGPITDWGRNG